MLLRPADPAEADRLTTVPLDVPVTGVTAQRYRDGLAVGSYRPQWSWLAEHDGRVLARALWWALPGKDQPQALDCLWVSDEVADRAALGAALLSAGHEVLRAEGLVGLPEYQVDLQPGWREHGAAVAALSWRTQAAAAAGLEHRLERLSYRWSPAAGVPVDTGRLVLRPEPDDDVIVAVLAAVAEGSLDDLTRRNRLSMGPLGQARDDLEFYLGLPSPRDWWRVARTADEALVGLALPTRSASDASVGYLAVVPSQRGRGYVDDLLAEITRQHADRGAERVTATTDADNAPMAAALRRAGYECSGVRIVFSTAAPVEGATPPR